MPGTDKASNRTFVKITNRDIYESIEGKGGTGDDGLKHDVRKLDEKIDLVVQRLRFHWYLIGAAFGCLLLVGTIIAKHIMGM